MSRDSKILQLVYRRRTHF